VFFVFFVAYNAAHDSTSIAVERCLRGAGVCMVCHRSGAADGEHAASTDVRGRSQVAVDSE
jgi:hypothetical protein